MTCTDASCVESTVEDESRRTGERTALPVFLIAGLLADEAQLRADRAFAQHSALSAGHHRLGL